MKFAVTATFDGGMEQALDLYYKLGGNLYDITNGKGAVKLEKIITFELSHDVVVKRDILRAGSDGSR